MLPLLRLCTLFLSAIPQSDEGIGTHQAILGTVSLSELTESPKDLPALRLPWQRVRPREGQEPQRAVLAELRSDASDAPWAATITGTSTPDGLELYVSVADPSHHNTQSGYAIWDGDAIQIMVHPASSQSDVMAARSESLAPGDLQLALGLGRLGAEAFILLRGGDESSGPYAHPFSVTRDETLGLTHYAVVIPYSLMHTTSARLHEVRLGIQVDNAHPDRPRQRLLWGVSPEGGFRPGLMQPVALSSNAQDHPQLFVEDATVWSEKAGALIGISIPPQTPSSAPSTLEIDCDGKTQKKISLPKHTKHWRGHLALHLETSSVGRSPSRNKRHRTQSNRPKAHPFLTPTELRATGLPPHVQQLPVALGCRVRMVGSKKEGLSEVSVSLRDAQTPLRTLGKDLDKLFSQYNEAPHHDVRLLKHLQSLGALFDLATADSVSSATSGERQGLYDLWSLATQISEQVMALHLHGTEAFARELAFGRRPHLGLLRSAVDGTWQPYVVQMPSRGPPKADEERLGVVLFLHGKASASQSRFMAAVLQRDTAEMGDAVWVTPWIRGNTGAQGAAEDDVLATLDQVHQHFPTDRDHVGLLGFSLGGSGAFNLALHRPETFSAVGIIAGGSWEVALGRGLGQNARGIPFYLWHGSQDTAVLPQEMARIQTELGQGHVFYEAHRAYGFGHTFPPSARHQALGFLSAHRRGPRDQWRYTSDGPRHRGRSGVVLRYDAAQAAFPAVEVQIDRSAGRVDLQTFGTKDLEVDLGPQGLNLTGEVSVFLNKELVYSGAPLHVTLGSGASRP